MKSSYASENFDPVQGRFVHPNREYQSETAGNKSRGDLWRLYRQFANRAHDPMENTGLPVTPLNTKDIIQGGNAAYWLGHSTYLVQYRGMRILTDPHFSQRASPFSFYGPKRHTPPPITIENLPPIDLVVISHSHYDHLDYRTIATLAAQQPAIHYVVPLGVDKLIKSWGVQHATARDWWEPLTIDQVSFTSTPVKHWSSRLFFDRNRTQWAGWMCQWPDFAFYFTGDSGYCDDFTQVRARLGAPDLAAIPIGAYEPRDFMKAQHVNPEEAVQIALDLQCRTAIAMHWGTFRLTLEPMDEPPKRLRQALASIAPGLRFEVLPPGGKLAIISRTLP